MHEPIIDLDTDLFVVVIFQCHYIFAIKKFHQEQKSWRENMFPYCIGKSDDLSRKLSGVKK